MTATQPHNRVSPYLDAPNPLPTPPATPEAREQVLADAVFAAILTLQRLLAHTDPQVAFKATAMILDFEKTRLRHGRPVVGTAPPPPSPQPDPFAECEPLPQQESAPPPRISDREQLERLDRMIADPLDDDDDDVGGKLKILPPKKKVNRADPLAQYVEQVRKLLQDEADAEGKGEVVSWHKAEWVAKKVLERQRPGQSLTAAPSRGRDAPPRESDILKRTPGPIPRHPSKPSA